MIFPLGSFFTSNIGAIVRQVFAAAGVGVISFAAISTAFQTALSYAQSAYNNVGTDALALVGLAGIGEAIGVIVGAMAFRVAFMSMPKLGVLPK